MSWKCPYCGKENQCDDRIGMQEPKCVRCGTKRTDLEAVQRELTKEKNEAAAAIAALKKQIEHIDEQIASLNDEVSALAGQREEVMAEYQEWVNEATRIEGKLQMIHGVSRGERHVVGADQTALGSFVKEEV